MQSEHSRSDSRGHVSNVAYNCNIKLVLSEKEEESEKEGENMVIEFISFLLTMAALQIKFF
jgi:hypothetical protein